MFKEACVDHIIRIKSDHAPILLHYNDFTTKKKKKKKKGFKFETFWLTDEACEEIVKDAWEGNENSDIMGKVTVVGRRLQMWSDEHYNKLGKQIADTEYALQKAQERPSNEESCKTCIELEQKLEELEGKYESYWHIRSRVAEVREGDKNTRYFHHKASQRQRKNTISGLWDGNGIWREDEEEIATIVSDYFEDIFTSSKPTNAAFDHVLTKVRAVISQAMNDRLTRPYTKEDVQLALKQMHPSKAPGPDVIRLKDVLKEIISENQSAFVPSRLITDNALIALECFHSMKKRSKGRKGHIAMKLDMSKAYDRVEWGFLRQLLLKMGFDGRWVNLSKAEKGDIHGVKASRKGPEISHLLFADDSLLFTRATRQECSNIVDILNQYEAASGQKINYEKSEVSFSRGVKTEQKTEILGILNMKQGWKEKMLSQAGKEILLKSLIQAIPTYLMGVYKFPIEVVRKIHSAMANFWWGQSEDRKRIHWKSWDSMCTLKCLGGMGFRDLEVFNVALLGRQAWRVLTNTTSLLSRVLKAKYYNNSDFLGA
ncbi:uncharacterized protein LOC110725072 [Chenopodium quinoa]|uniref:uncharacterized protein LOC110725072 n=1 Tax=Chenopodium quinoa TaxID=63459 RepID=UPI000B776C43|nr:uncharacterized protein LOC110725072 [Chenopodium quinoa]